MAVFSAQELLKRHGIDYVATKHGKFTTTCPQCDNGYLNVRIERKKVVWYCHNCDDGGSEKFEQSDAAPDLGPIKAVYDYQDENRVRLFQALRFEPLNQPKQFRQRTDPDQKKWSIKGIRIVPFRLPELIEAVADDRVVFVVEGEKDVLTLVARGFAATCNPMGAGKWRSEFSKFFEGADVVVCGDNDAPGRDHVHKVARNLQPVARCVRVLDLKTMWPGIEESDDITDWFERANGTAAALQEIIGQVEPFQDYADEPPPWEEPRKAGNGHDPTPFVVPLFPYIARPFNEIPAREWLHAGHYVRKHVVMTIAPGGYGKSSLLLCNALEMVTGRGLIGPQPVERTRCLYWNGEEPEKAEIERRIAALCTAHSIKPKDLEGELFLGDKIMTDDWRFAIIGKNGPIPNARLIKTVTEFIGDHKIGCMQLDPWIAFHRLSESDTGAMEVLVKDIFYPIASITNCCIELSHHTRKANQNFTAEITVDDSRGAGAAANACRSARVINRMTKDEARDAGIAVDVRTLYLRVHRDKQNLAPPSKAKWVKLQDVHLENEDHVQAVIAWEWPKHDTTVPTESKHYLRHEVRSNSYRLDTRATAWVGIEIGRHLGLRWVSTKDPNDNDRERIAAIVNALLAEKVFAVESRKTDARQWKDFIIPGAWIDEEEEALQSRLF
jgi:hypothetical protein